jgi:inner membrane protein
MPDLPERLSSSLRHSQTLRLLTVAVLVVLLLIPIGMIRGLVSERQERQALAIGDISSKWGGLQQVVGPFLVVPYTVDVAETNADGKPVVRRFARHAIFLADELDSKATLQIETRSRGIYDVPVYRMELVVAGKFGTPRFAELGIEPSAVEWDRAQLVLGVSDTRAIQERTAVQWNGEPVPMMPGGGTQFSGRPGIHAIVSLAGGAPSIPFTLPLTVNGSLGAYFVPFGESSVVEMKSNYPHPSFQGNWLPTERGVGGDGFDAKWSIPFLGRNFPQSWPDASALDLDRVVESSRFGVDFANPVDHYSMAERGVKYAALFILLTFATLWLFEVRASVRVHPIQFLMLGGALCLFYLLLLSLSEHIPFVWAYAIASVAVIAMVASYGLIVLGAASRAIAIGTVVTMLYGYLYVLLVNEDYALLIGSIGLFLILGAIMYATRRVDWYAVGRTPER